MGMPDPVEIDLTRYEREQDEQGAWDDFIDEIIDLAEEIKSDATCTNISRENRLSRVMIAAQEIESIVRRSKYYDF